MLRTLQAAQSDSETSGLTEEYDSEDLASEFTDSAIGKRQISSKRTNSRVCTLICAMSCVVLVSAISLCTYATEDHPTIVASSSPAEEAHYHNVLSRMNATATIPDHIPVTNLISYGILVGLNKQNMMQALVLASFAWLCVVGSTTVAVIVVVGSPWDVQDDFEQKGTISDVCQDVSLPRGRIFTVSLFTSGVLLISSMYTFWLYRCWIPLFNQEFNPVMNVTLQSEFERFWRMIWLVFPQVGNIFTAAVPSPSDTTGTRFYLMLVHNVLAPLALIFAATMETVQLNYGEHVFSRFFSNEPAFPYGSVTLLQRVRAVMLIIAWTTGLSFIGIQCYLWTGPCFGVKTKTSYSLAFTSFILQVATLVNTSLLPALAGLDMYTDMTENYLASAQPIHQSALAMIHFDYPYNLTTTRP